MQKYQYLVVIQKNKMTYITHCIIDLIEVTWTILTRKPVGLQRKLVENPKNTVPIYCSITVFKYILRTIGSAHKL